MTGVLPSTGRALLHEVATVQAGDRQPSVVAGLVRAGELVWSGARGAETGGPEAGNDLQYRIGSLTKTFTAVLVMQCRDEGLLDLADPLATRLPGGPYGQPTLRQLLAHDGGLPAEPAGPWWEWHDADGLDDLFDRVADQPAVLPMGAHHHYSNLGYALLGAVVERLRAQPWIEALRERVLDPLGMGRTTYDSDRPHAQGWSVHPWSGRLEPQPHTDTGAMAPAGQLWSTVNDLARWAGFLLRPDPAVLAPASLTEMTVPTAAEPGDVSGAYGLGLRVDHAAGHLRYGHGGSMPGFLAGILVDAQQGAGAVALANATRGGTPLPARLLNILHDSEPALPAWTPERELAGADELLGPWYWGNTPQALAVRGGRLVLEPLPTGPGTRFVPAGTDRWRGLDGYYTGETLRVVRGESGAVDHLDLASYELRRTPSG